MDILAGVLFHVNPGQAHPFGLIGLVGLIVERHVKIAVLGNRQLVHADLVTLGQIRIKIVLARPAAAGRDPAVGGQGGFEGILDHPFVEHRQDPGQAHAHRTGVVVGLGAKLS